jgi:DNA-binding NarL/FixJ family response regulator
MTMTKQADRSPQFVDKDVLLGADRVIRARLVQALETERITAHGLAKLRGHYGLTPAETSVFIEYYLGGMDLPDGQSSIRRALAQDLTLSENTLMHHITSIRRKLGFAARKGSATVLVWCLTTGITELRTLTSCRSVDQDMDRPWSQALQA